MSHSQMIDAFLGGVQLLRQAVAGMSREQLLARPVAGKWSTLQVVCHLNDSETIYADRMKRIIAEDQPLMLSADESRYAAALLNHEREIEEELNLIQLTRQQMARLLRPLPRDTWARAGLYRREGKENLCTLEQLLTTATRHLTHHVATIYEKRRALGLTAPAWNFRIETVCAANFEQLLPLIADYQRFYRTEPDPARNRTHFSQFLDNHERGVLFAARGEDGAVVGFATLYFPLSSSRARSYCLMNDLYTVPCVRGSGVGRALIEHCRGYARQKGFATLEWETEQTNQTAQRLYDRTGALRSAWFRYTLPVH